MLRFSTTVATALHIGIREVIVREDLCDALEVAQRLEAPLIAEVDGFKPGEANLDNSPTEVILHLSRRPPEKVVIRSTAGASILVEAVKRKCKEIIVGGLVNAAAIARYLSSIKPQSVSIVMAGFRGEMFAVEDLLGAGAIVAELLKMAPNSDGAQLLTDEALVAYELYMANREHLVELVSRSRSGRLLIETGRIKDVEFCSKVNTIDIVPKVENYEEVALTKHQ